MKTTIALLVLAMAAVLPAHAGRKDIQDLAAYTGISERKVMMILGARSAYAEYPYTYQRYKTRFVKALGQQNYQRLVSGKAIRLDNGVVVRIRTADSVANVD